MRATPRAEGASQGILKTEGIPVDTDFRPDLGHGQVIGLFRFPFSESSGTHGGAFQEIFRLVTTALLAFLHGRELLTTDAEKEALEQLKPCSMMP